MKRVLITGHQGYVGPVLCAYLRRTRPEWQLVGVDTGFFDDALTVQELSPQAQPHTQWALDVRAIQPQHLVGVDGVIHLAAISNDPMGQHFESVTDEINHQATVRLAQMAKQSGVRQFVFASSCSVYGVDDAGVKSESSAVQPLTAYARSKVAAERALEKLASADFGVTALRFATACGFSPRCRLDLVLNDFVAASLAWNEIRLLSDGAPWRPLIHVEDMARAMEWALLRPQGEYLCINAGSGLWNFKIGELAQAVAARVGGVSVHLNPEASPDKRSYRVNFDEFMKLAPLNQPVWTLDAAVDELSTGLRSVVPKDNNFREGPFNRLKKLTHLVACAKLDDRLYRPQAAQDPASPGLAPGVRSA